MLKKTQARIEDEFYPNEMPPKGCSAVSHNERIDKCIQMTIIKVREMPQWGVDLANELFGTDFNAVVERLATPKGCLKVWDNVRIELNGS